MEPIQRSFKSRKNNIKGRLFEGYIEGACAFYKRVGRAVITKVPEPFRTTSTARDGTFTGRFIANAHPDFLGTLDGGLTICFEAKYTGTEKMQQSVITKVQWEALESYWNMGASAGVCVGIKDTFAFIPWDIWKDMKEIYGRKYLTEQDIERYKVRFLNGHCLFLDYFESKEKEE